MIRLGEKENKVTKFGSDNFLISKSKSYNFTGVICLNPKVFFLSNNLIILILRVE